MASSRGRDPDVPRAGDMFLIFRLSARWGFADRVRSPCYGERTITSIGAVAASREANVT
jgi:hypothetical protein